MIVSLIGYYGVRTWILGGMAVRVQRGDCTVAANMTQPIQVQKYVSLSAERLRGNHRIGNHLFMFATFVFIGARTGRVVAMSKSGWLLDEAFDVDVTRVDTADHLCPCRALLSPEYNYDKTFDNPSEMVQLTAVINRTLVFGHFAQTYRCAAAVEKSLRKVLRFRKDIFDEASRVRMEIRLADGWNWFTVGVHIRRGDFLQFDLFGLTVVDAEYLQRAFEYFTMRYTRIKFIIATKNWTWTSTNLPTGLDTSTTQVIHTGNNTAGVDLAILSLCDAVVVSTGSFEWWAAWLANTATFYYNNWPRPGSQLARTQDKAGYFPPHWIPFD